MQTEEPGVVKDPESINDKAESQTSSLKPSTVSVASWNPSRSVGGSSTASPMRRRLALLTRM